MREPELLLAVLVFVRLATLVSRLAPLAGGPVPATVKIGLAAALSLAWTPLATEGALATAIAALTGPCVGLAIGWLVIREVVIGLAVAWVLGLVYVPVQVAGAYLGQELGLTLGGLTSPIDQQPSSVITQVLEPLATIALFASNAHHGLLRALYRSLDLFPVGGGGPSPDAAWVTRCVDGAQRIGLELVAPIGVGLGLLLVGLLLLMRLVPQFNYQTFGGPLRLAGGMLLLAALAPDLLVRLQQLWGHFATL